METLDQKLVQLEKIALNQIVENLDLEWAGSELAAKCQSPIERLMLAAILAQFQVRNVCDMGDCIGPSHTIAGRYVEPDESTWPFDVGLVAGEFNFVDVHIGPDWWIKTPEIVIECDGHEFHERTKEQAGRDKLRDRVLQQAGHPVLRFTGSEIWRSAWNCSVEIGEFLKTRVREAEKNS